MAIKNILELGKESGPVILRMSKIVHVINGERKGMWGLMFLGMCLSGAPLHAYTAVQLAPGTSETIEQSFLQATTSQFDTVVTTNPFFPNTYQVTLKGINPTYNPPPSNADLMNILPQYPFAAGMMYERTNDEGWVGASMALCGNTTNFVLNPSTTTVAAWNPETCNDVLGFIDNWLVTQTSGVAVIPNPLPGL